MYNCVYNGSYSVSSGIGKSSQEQYSNAEEGEGEAPVDEMEDMQGLELPTV